jgi:hypothetical protein
MKTDKTAGRILAFLSLTAFLLSVAIIFFGVETGEFENKIIKPVKNYVDDFVKSRQVTPIPTILPTPSPSPTLKPKPTIINKPTTNQGGFRQVSCIRKNIREGEFASNKCYSRQDYEDLEYYLQKFNSSVFNLDAAEGTIRITCNCRVPQECEFFKQSCDEAKQKKSQAETDINRYRGIIQGIIAKGK